MDRFDVLQWYDSMGNHNPMSQQVPQISPPICLGAVSTPWFAEAILSAVPGIASRIIAGHTGLTEIGNLSPSA